MFLPFGFSQRIMEATKRKALAAFSDAAKASIKSAACSPLDQSNGNPRALKCATTYKAESQGI